MTSRRGRMPMTSRAVVTVGTFDGVHRGHQRIIRRVLQIARQSSLRSTVLTFPISPRHLFNPASPPQLLTDMPERQALLRRLGVERIHVLPFTRRLAAVPAETFFQRVLVRRLKAARVVVGYNFAFGRARGGDAALLGRLGEQARVRVDQVGMVSYRHRPVSSQRIRDLIRSGAVEQAAEFLGYPYSLAGPVMKGRGEGTRLGFSTANVSTHAHKLLPPGVFGVRAWIEDVRVPRPWLSGKTVFGLDEPEWEGICNVGYHPTFGRAPRPLLEVHLLGWTGGSLRGRHLRVMFLFRIRAERRFPTVKALQRRIRQDIAACTHRLPEVTKRLYKIQSIY